VWNLNLQGACTLEMGGTNVKQRGGRRGMRPPGAKGGHAPAGGGSPRIEDPGGKKFEHFGVPKKRLRGRILQQNRGRGGGRLRCGGGGGSAGNIGLKAGNATCSEGSVVGYTGREELSKKTGQTRGISRQNPNNHILSIFGF